MRCMCELLVSLPHFNFRNNILAVVVPRMVSKRLDGKVRVMQHIQPHNLLCHCVRHLVSAVRLLRGS